MYYKVTYGIEPCDGDYCESRLRKCPFVSGRYYSPECFRTDLRRQKIVNAQDEISAAVLATESDSLFDYVNLDVELLDGDRLMLYIGAPMLPGF